MADLDRVLQGLHDSEINAGVQTFFDAGMRVWIGDEVNGIQAETVFTRMGFDRTHVARGSHSGELAIRDRSTSVPR